MKLLVKKLPYLILAVFVRYMLFKTLLSTEHLVTLITFKTLITCK